MEIKPRLFYRVVKIQGRPRTLSAKHTPSATLIPLKYIKLITNFYEKQVCLYIKIRHHEHLVNIKHLFKTSYQLSCCFQSHLFYSNLWNGEKKKWK